MVLVAAVVKGRLESRLVDPAKDGRASRRTPGGVRASGGRKGGRGYAGPGGREWEPTHLESSPIFCLMIAISVVSSSCVSTHAGATEADTASTPESPWSEYPFSAPPSRREESLGISSRARKSVGKERNCVSGSAGGGTVGEGKWCFHDELRVSPLLKSVPVGVLPLPQGREGRRSVPREPFCARHGRPNASPPSPFSRRPSPPRLRHFPGGGGIARPKCEEEKRGASGRASGDDQS